MDIFGRRNVLNQKIIYNSFKIVFTVSNSSSIDENSRAMLKRFHVL